MSDGKWEWWKCWVFLGVAETIVGWLLWCGLDIVRCLFSLLYDVIRLSHPAVTPRCPMYVVLVPLIQRKRMRNWVWHGYYLSQTWLNMFNKESRILGFVKIPWKSLEHVMNINHFMANESCKIIFHDLTCGHQIFVENKVKAVSWSMN